MECYGFEKLMFSNLVLCRPCLNIEPLFRLYTSAENQSFRSNKVQLMALSLDVAVFKQSTKGNVLDRVYKFSY